MWDDVGNTCGNLCPVVDGHTGAVWLPMTWNRGEDKEPDIIAQTSRDTRRVFLSCSEDEGETWTPPREITDDIKRPSWTWYATGPGVGIQIEHGPHRGRLVVPRDHVEAGTRRCYFCAISSDDHGTTWMLGGRTRRLQEHETAAAYETALECGHYGG